MGSRSTPGRTRSVRTAPARQAPRSLKIRTRSPPVTPRSAASAGCSSTASRPATFEARLSAPVSSWLCSRVAGWLAISSSGCRSASGPPSRSCGSSQLGWPGQSGRSIAAMVADASSIRPLGVASGNRSGSARKSANRVRSAGPCGNCHSPAVQNSSNGGGCAVAEAVNSSAHSAYRCSSHWRGVRPSVKRPPKPSRSARADSTAKSSRASPCGSTARCIAIRWLSRRPPPKSSRSRAVVTGRTMSACRAVAVQCGSWTMTVSGRAKARRSRPRSWWWWKGFPPAQCTSRMSG